MRPLFLVVLGGGFGGGARRILSLPRTGPSEEVKA